MPFRKVNFQNATTLYHLPTRHPFPAFSYRAAFEDKGGRSFGGSGGGDSGAEDAQVLPVRGQREHGLQDGVDERGDEGAHIAVDEGAPATQLQGAREGRDPDQGER